MIMYSKIKRIVSLILCCTLAAALFCGCQRQNGQENNLTGTPGSAGDAAINSSSENAANNAIENAAADNVSENDAANNAAENAAANNTSENSSENVNTTVVCPPADFAGEFRNTHNEVARTEKYTIYELSFERDGLTIYGQFYLPNTGSVHYPLVIVSHGFEGSFRLNTYISESFAKAGLAVYVFDFCGGSTFSLSGGSMLDMSVLTEKEDLMTVFDGLSSLEFIDKSRIFLMGESQGGFVSALVASERPDDVAGLVLFYPAFVIPDNGRNLYGSKENIPEYAYAFKLTVGRRYYSDVIDMDPYEEIGGYEGDVLLIHGDQDVVVPYSYSQKALEVYKNAELITIRGSNHGFTGQNLVDACNASVSFINDHLH